MVFRGCGSATWVLGILHHATVNIQLRFVPTPHFIKYTNVLLATPQLNNSLISSILCTRFSSSLIIPNELAMNFLRS